MLYSIHPPVKIKKSIYWQNKKEKHKELYLVLCGDTNGKTIQHEGIYVST